MKARLTVALGIAGMFAALSGRTAPFAKDWPRAWTPLLETRNSVVRRMPGGALEVDATPGKHVYYLDGEEMRDVRLTARIKFLRADDKYSGFSVYLRWNGRVWGERAGFWVYLRPKFRGLYMQKVVDGKLDKEFGRSIKAKRPKSTPLNEWLTLRYEAVGRRIRVYLNDELHLSVTDAGPFPITGGRVAFGVDDAHVIVADLEQEDLERSDRIRRITYRYMNPPNRGDSDRRILTDGKVNARDKQAFWRMLGARPEIVFDLGAETFVTRIILKAFSSPALNIATAEVLGSDDGETWRSLAMLTNRDSRRADAEHEIAGEVRGIARYVKLILNRPAADQDVELAEVEFYGRPPTDRDREAASVKPYDTGPPLPRFADSADGDPNYFFLTSPAMKVAIHRKTGVVAGLWNRERNTRCLERQHDRYHLATREGDVDADEYGDRVAEVLSGGEDGMVHLRCTNAKLPDIRIDKRYSLSPDGRRLIKRAGFVNTSPARDRFLTHVTGAIAAEDFRRGGVYMGCDRGLGARLFADEVTVPRQVGALGARNSKVVILHRYDLDWGVGQFRHKINDVWCRPLTARYYEKENHPPIYLPNGWEMGVCTLHLPPNEEQSTEIQTALYNGRQIDFYRMWRFLPETKAAWDAVKRPTWQRDLKTSAKISAPQFSADQATNMMPVRRGLRIAATGNLWYLAHIHGVWGDWFSDGMVETGVGARIDTAWLKEFIARMHAASPRMKTGVYTWAWAVHPRSNVFREHPEWFIQKDRNGQVFNAYSNMVLNHLRLMSVPGSMDELIGEFGELMRKFRGDFFYLDGGGGGANLIDWEHLTIDYDTHWEELYRRIRQVARACGDDKGVWFNARTGPCWDVGYYEGIDRSLHAATWRDSADGLSIVKIRQVFDPDQVVVPLYWRPSTRPFYSNYCIGLGITPASPLGADELLRKLPFIEAAYETRRMRWIEADLEPDWRVNPRTEIEAYALKHGRAAVISLIDHREGNPGPAVISADTRKLGLDPAKPVCVFVFGNRDIRKSWKALPEGTRRAVYRRTGWGLDTVARVLDVRVIEAPGPRIELRIPTQPNLLRMAVLSTSPAALFSVNGLRVNFWAPEVLGAAVSCEKRGDELLLQARAPKGGAEIVVCAPPGKRLTGEDVRHFHAGGVSIAVVPVAAGKSTVALALEDAPAAGGTLRVTCPKTVAAGMELPVTVTPAPASASVAVRRNDALVAVKNVSLTKGTFALSVPVQARSGTWTVSVNAEIGGKLRHGTAEFATTGAFEPKLPPVYRPKRYPKPVVARTDVMARGLHVIGAATNSHDGYDGAHVPLAEPHGLRFGGAMSAAPRSRYGYAFGGLEFEKARVLTLKVTNTIHNAWTFNRGRVSFKPQYTSLFAGMFIDYRTAKGYTRRVALGLGILNPKRTSPHPKWGKSAKPDRFVMLGDMVHRENESTFTIDLARWAPPGWTGRCWLSAGVHSLYPGRGVTVEILDAANSAKDKKILEGEDLGGLYKLKTYRIARTATAPRIDGKLDDPAWKNAEPATGFYVFGRTSVAEQKTAAWITYDDTNLYIAFDCPETARPLNVSSEKLWGRDAVDVALNPCGDRKTFLQIIVDANGEFDQFSHSPDGKKFKWDGVRVAAGRRQGGWTVEIAVPLKSMDLKPVKGFKWSGNFVRYRAGDPMSTWSFMPGPAINDPERMAVFVLD
ncbi:MAG: hypothetical protein GXP31_13375 [Kiritimatiellaeota bacterium]|nr:hypothetical protein [Kiritimatiellota bacterium]